MDSISISISSLLKSGRDWKWKRNPSRFDFRFHSRALLGEAGNGIESLPYPALLDGCGLGPPRFQMAEWRTQSNQ